MGFVTSALTAYVNQESTDLLIPAITQGETANIVTVIPGIKSSQALQKFTNTIVWADDDCAFSAGADASTYSQRNLAVDEIKIQEVLCPRNLEPFWTQKMLSAGDDYTEADIPAMYMELRMKLVQESIEIAIWQAEDGVGAGNLAFTDGFLMKIDGDGQGVCVNGNPNDILEATGIVAGNVVSIFQTQYENIPEALVGNSAVTSFCGWDTFRTYLIALTNANMFHYVSDGATESGSITLPGLGLKIQAVAGLTGTNRIITADPANLYVGTDLVSEFDRLTMWVADDNRNIRSDISFKLGTEIAYLEEVVDFRLYPS
jgi:hypothetical protein